MLSSTRNCVPPGRVGWRRRLRGGRARGPVRAGQGGVGAGRERGGVRAGGDELADRAVHGRHRGVDRRPQRGVVECALRLVHRRLGCRDLPGLRGDVGRAVRGRRVQRVLRADHRLLGVGDGEPARSASVTSCCCFAASRLFCAVTTPLLAEVTADWALVQAADDAPEVDIVGTLGVLRGRRRRRAAGRQHRHGGAARARRLAWRPPPCRAAFLAWLSCAAGVVDGRLGGVVLRVGLGLGLVPGSSGPGRGCPASPRPAASCSASRAWPAGCAAARGPGRGPAARRTGRWWRAPGPP